jgi:hypothetical protein
MLEPYVGLKVVRRRQWRRFCDDQGVIEGVDPKIGHKGVEPMSSVSWRIRLSELSCVSLRHHHYK